MKVAKTEKNVDLQKWAWK